MSEPLTNSLTLMVPIGTQVVSRVEIKGTDGKPTHPAGVVGVITAAPLDHEHCYRVRFPDGYEASLRRHEIITLRDFQLSGLHQTYSALAEYNLQDYVIYRCVVGSRAYGLDEPGSDTDRRGVYLPPAELHWSLYGVPEQLENPANQDCYWEIQKFLVMALKANPNVLECLYSPLVEHATPLAREMLDMRHVFLSKIVYQTYNGYVLSQFKKLGQDLRNKGEVKWKHVMHLIRLLISGITALREGQVPVRVEQHREELLAIRRGERKWEDINRWRLELHEQFDAVAVASKLPERPDYARANAFLVKSARPDGHGGLIMTPLDARFGRKVRQHPRPLLFATVSGAHLYGFPSPDSDYDLRGAHVLPVPEVIRLTPGMETIELSNKATMASDGIEFDIVSHDIKKFFGLMLKKNGYVLEQLYSPLVVHTTPEHEELKAIGRGCITKHHSHHYLGFVDTQWKLFDKERPRRVKPLLYVYRVLLTGIHLMRTGAIEANLLILNDDFKLPFIDDLVARKRAGPEHAVLPDAEMTFHEGEYQRLTHELEAAHEASTLPEVASTRAVLDDLLVRVRLSTLYNRS